MDSENVICKIKSDLVDPIGWKYVELNYLYDNLIPGNCLIIGEGGESGREGVSATVLYHNDIIKPIVCVDIVKYSDDSFMDLAEKNGQLKFINEDLCLLYSDCRYDNLVCLNVLEHFGFLSEQNLPSKPNYYLDGIKKMCALCAENGQIILTIPYALENNDTFFTGGRNFSEKTIREIEECVRGLGFFFYEEITVINVNKTNNFFEMDEVELDVKRKHNDNRDEFLKCIIIKRNSRNE